MAHEAEAAPQLEPPGVSLRPVLGAALASILLMLGAIWGMTAVYDRWVSNHTVPSPEQFPPPRVQTHQAEQRRDLLDAQRRQLTGYAWADPGKTLVRIPIERAMAIIAQRGIAAYGPLQPPSHAMAAPTGAVEPATTGQAPSGGGPAQRLDGDDAGVGGVGVGDSPHRHHGRSHRRRRR